MGDGLVPSSFARLAMLYWEPSMARAEPVSSSVRRSDRSFVVLALLFVAEVRPTMAAAWRGEMIP